MPRSFKLLPWDRPLLQRAVEYLAAGWSGGALDLSDHLIVVPTRQAGRRLREALAVHADSRGAAVLAPRVVVAEQVLEMAVAPSVRIAERVQALLAWAAELRAVDLETLRAVFPVNPPRRNLAWALQFAREMMRLQSELAEEGLRFADVPDHAGAGFSETERWTQLAALEVAVDARLHEAGLVAPDAAKIAAANAPAPLAAELHRVVVLAVVDPVPLALRVLEGWSRDGEVEIIGFGPADGAALFDPHGRPNVAAWAERRLALTGLEKHVHVCADPAAQADCVAQWADKYRGRSGVFGIGCADPAVQPALMAGLAQASLQSYLPAGVPMRRSALMGLLLALRNAAREETWERIAHLARQPTMLDWLGSLIPEDFSPERFLAGLDALQARHLPPNLAAARRHAGKFDSDRAGVSAGLGHLDALLTRLRNGAFPAAWFEVLAQLFAGREPDRAEPAERAFAETAQAWREVASEVAAATPPGAPADEAEELALQLFGEIARYEEKPAEALELNGWLELIFSDEPHLIIAGCNDGAVPKAVTGHAFMPETLRERLGLKTNAQRLACDAWQLAALAACRAEGGRLDLVLGRTSAAGDPLRPSRLLFLCDDAELPGRVEFLFRDLPPPAHNPPWRRAWKWRPTWRPPPRSLRVTAFRDYLKCPFRFYLRRVLEMEPVDAAKRELDRLDFGVLVHGVLEQLGREPAWGACTDERTLADAFDVELDRRVREQFGPELSLPLVVQVESARQRLRQAARIQAAERAAGWEIVHTEWRFPREKLALGGLAVTGTIDRIERHEATGRWRVLDYKTSESATPPAKAHLAGARGAEGDLILPEARVALGGTPQVWTDLQLPLYRWAVGEALGLADVQVGYFNLPKAVTGTAISLWDDYDGAWHEAALRCAHGVVTAVAAGRFWPPREEVRNDDFAALIHDGAAASFDVSGWPAPEGEGAT